MIVSNVIEITFLFQDFGVATQSKNPGYNRVYDGLFGLGLDNHSSYKKYNEYYNYYTLTPPMLNAQLSPKNAFSFYMYEDPERESGFGGEVRYISWS